MGVVFVIDVGRFVLVLYDIDCVWNIFGIILYVIDVIDLMYYSFVRLCNLWVILSDWNCLIL